MVALIDTGFLYATLDISDKYHNRARNALARSTEDLLLPTVVLVELTYLLQARLGHSAMRLFIQQLADSPLPLIPVTQADIPRIYELLDQYADMRLDFVDAALTAIAERLRIQRILTVDRRDFLAIRPRHCSHFDLVP